MGKPIEELNKDNFFFQERDKKHRNPYHFENDLVIIIDLELSGLDPANDSMTSLKFLPVDGIKFEMSEVFPPLHIETILPNKIDTFNLKKYSKARATEVLKSNIDLTIANHLFIDWFTSLKMYKYTRLMPVCFNWADYRPFIIELCGDFETFTKLFHPKHFIDLSSAQYFVEDLAWNNSEKYPFDYMAKNVETSTIRKLEVVRVNPINTYARCMDIAECYKKLRTLSLPKGIDIK